MFYHGTVEFRLFNATLHAGEVKANIVLAMAISAQAINQQKTLAHKTPIGDNPAFTFRTFLLRLGLIGPEYKNVQEHRSDAVLFAFEGQPGKPEKECCFDDQYGKASHQKK